MSFLEVVKKCSHTKNIKLFTNFLRVYSFLTHRAYTTPQKIKATKRRALPYPQFIPGAVSVEAALAVPLFIFFMTALMMLIIVFRNYSETLADVQQSARSMALTSVEEDNSSEFVTVDKTISISPLVKNFVDVEERIYVGMKYRKWTGYNLDGLKASEKEEEYVYITKFGTVYHKNRGCKYLNVKLYAISKDEVDLARNMSGERYSACEICKGAGSGILFVSEEGSKYHASASCSGLKRSVRVVKLSDVEGMSPCSICGK